MKTSKAGVGIGTVRWEWQLPVWQLGMAALRWWHGAEAHVRPPAHPGVMVNATCQLGWAEGFPDS